MFAYSLLYILSIYLILYTGLNIYKKYKNISGIFFLFFISSISVWFILYFFFFSGLVHDEGVLLFISRLSFFVSLIGIYAFLFFIRFFDPYKYQKLSLSYFDKLLRLITGGVIIITLAYIIIGTNFIIMSLDFSPTEGVFHEVYGILFPVYASLYVIFPVPFFYYSFQQLRKQSVLNRVRLLHVIYSAFIFLVVGVILQIILPLFGIWILEKEFIFLFLGFVIYISSIVQRYYFIGRGIQLGKIFSIFLAFFCTIFCIIGFRLLYGNMYSSLAEYWGFHDPYFLVDTIFGISIYSISYRINRHLFPGNTTEKGFKQSLNRLEKNISHLTRFDELNVFLGKEMKKIIKCSYCCILEISEGKFTQLHHYFNSHLEDPIFLNDIVFIEENKHKFQKATLLKELPKDAFLILPIYDGNLDTTHIFILGIKPLGDFYTVYEIDVLRQFVFFLELHLKYIQTYEKIQDYSMNLDKKVDEKTIEYNDLINKQKEFISVISHEIKTPIASAIFQADSILDDIDAKKTSPEYLRSEVALLNTQLIKTGELLSKLFSVQYYDTHSVTLFREKIQVAHLLETECEIYAKMNEHIQFITRIDRSMGFIELDRIQFQQVIDNLLQNAVKFSCPNNPIILIEASIIEGILTIRIEDNGPGFDGINIQKLFDKYVTGGGVSTGLGMGLYLCKRIIEMHGGTIQASQGNNGEGAQFIIQIPTMHS